MKSIIHETGTIVHRCILEVVGSLPRKDRPSAKACRKLAQSIALVSLKIRTACLVDFCRIPAPQRTLPKLIANLRESCTACAPIFALIDPTSDDVFFVNSELLALKLSEEAPSDSAATSSSYRIFSPTTVLKNTILVLLDERLRTLESLPEPLLSLLLHLHSTLLSPTQEKTPQQRVPSLPHLVPLASSELGPSVQVPLAGILLDYSVAYVPLPQLIPEHNEAYLSGEALDVFEFCLRSSKTSESLEIMKFSCPAEFSSTRTLNIIHERVAPMIDHLNSNIDGGQGPAWELVSSRSCVVMDRVAL